MQEGFALKAGMSLFIKERKKPLRLPYFRLLQNRIKIRERRSLVVW